MLLRIFVKFLNRPDASPYSWWIMSASRRTDDTPSKASSTWQNHALPTCTKQSLDIAAAHDPFLIKIDSTEIPVVTGPSRQDSYYQKGQKDESQCAIKPRRLNVTCGSQTNPRHPNLNKAIGESTEHICLIPDAHLTVHSPPPTVTICRHTHTETRSDAYLKASEEMQTWPVGNTVLSKQFTDFKTGKTWEYGQILESLQTKHNYWPLQKM